MGTPGDWTRWLELGQRIQRHYDEVVVLRLPGWRQSGGGRAEIRMAADLGKPVRRVEANKHVGVARAAPLV